MVVWDGQVSTPAPPEQSLASRGGGMDENDPAGLISPTRRERIRATTSVSSTIIVRSMR